MKHYRFLFCALLLLNATIHAQVWEEVSVQTTSTTIPVEEATFDMLDANGIRWLGTTKGLYYEENNQVHHLELGDEAIDYIVNQFFDSEGKLWVSTFDAMYRIDHTTVLAEFPFSDFGIAEFDGHSMEVYAKGNKVLLHGPKQEYTSPFLKCFLFDGTNWDTLKFTKETSVMKNKKEDEIWFQNSDAFVKYKNGITTAFSLPVNSNLAHLFKIALESSDGAVWISSGSSIFRIKNETMLAYNFENEYFNSNIIEATDGSVYAYFSNSGQIIRFIEDRTERLNFIDPVDFRSQTYVSFFNYQGELLWRERESIYKFNPDSSIAVVTSGGLITRSSKVLVNTAGSLLLIQYSDDKSSVYKWNGSSWVDPGYFFDVWIDPWACDEEKISGHRHSYNETKIADHHLYEFIETVNGWIQKPYHPMRPNGLASDEVYTMQVDPLGTKWYATRAGISVQVSESEWFQIAYDSSYMPFDIYDMKIANDQSVWLGTSAGLMKYNGSEWERWSTQNGLLSDSVTQVLFDRTNRLWLAGAKGITRFNGGTFVHYDTIATFVFDEPLRFPDRYKPLTCNSNNELFAINTNKLFRLVNTTWSFEYWTNGDVSFTNFQNTRDPYFLQLYCDRHDSLRLDIGYFGSNGYNGAITSYYGTLANAQFNAHYGNGNYGYSMIVDNSGIPWTIGYSQNDKAVIIKSEGNEIRFDAIINGVLMYERPFVFSAGEIWINTGVLYHYKNELVMSADERESERKSYLTVFPVPASSHVSFSGDMRGQLAVLVDMTGIEKMKAYVDDNNQVDISSIPVGVYTMLIRQNALKLVKQ